ncbi:hypothetical protein H5410_008377 [Solanum commersonii]|uniref:Uncharacterized protein n=1 Tax=Solanum commersonii TaxID=4109 RepID=A0A9J6AGL8_SOLCO|nr:hypothetical protein H5410_008377 [Solanum commersonii]
MPRSGELCDPEIGNVEDPPLKPMVICETETRMEKRGCERNLDPSDLSYSPNKTTWKGKEAFTTSQLQAEVKKKRVNQLTKKEKWPVDTTIFLNLQTLNIRFQGSVADL